MYNLEATPAEGTTYRFAKEDRKRWPDILQAGTPEMPYYTNSSQLPVGFTDDPFEALTRQEELQTKYTGGTVVADGTLIATAVGNGIGSTGSSIGSGPLTVLLTNLGGGWLLGERKDFLSNFEKYRGRVLEVKSWQIFPGGSCRHPNPCRNADGSIKWRTDKLPTDCTWP